MRRVRANCRTQPVAARDQYAAPVAAVVERERSDLPTLGVVTPVAEEVVAEAFALGGFEKARRDDLVGIYVFRADGHRPDVKVINLNLGVCFSAWTFF